MIWHRDWNSRLGTKSYNAKYLGHLSIGVELIQEQSFLSTSSSFGVLAPLRRGASFRPDWLWAKENWALFGSIHVSNVRISACIPTGSVLPIGAFFADSPDQIDENVEPSTRLTHSDHVR